MSDIINKVKNEIKEDKEWIENEKEALAATVNELENKISNSPCSNEINHNQYNNNNNISSINSNGFHLNQNNQNNNQNNNHENENENENETIRKKLIVDVNCINQSAFESNHHNHHHHHHNHNHHHNKNDNAITQEIPVYKKIGDPNRNQYLLEMRDLLLTAIRYSNFEQVKLILTNCPKAIFFTYSFNPSSIISSSLSSSSTPSTSTSLSSSSSLISSGYILPILHSNELKPSNVLNGNKIILEESSSKHTIEKITFLHLACQQHDTKIVEYLLQYYNDVNIQSTDGRTPLYYTNIASIISLLCLDGANVNHLDRKGISPLYLYTNSQLYSCVQTILEYGGDPTLNDSKKRLNSLFIAVKKGDYQLLSLMLSYGILKSYSLERLTEILNQVDYDGNNLLHYLTMNTQAPTNQIITCIIFLLNYKVSFLTKNSLGITPFHYLISNQTIWNNSNANNNSNNSNNNNYNNSPLSPYNQNSSNLKNSELINKSNTSKIHSTTPSTPNVNDEHNNFHQIMELFRLIITITNPIPRYNSENDNDNNGSENDNNNNNNNNNNNYNNNDENDDDENNNNNSNNNSNINPLINIRDNENCTPLILACIHRKFELCKLLLLNKANMNISCPMNCYLLKKDYSQTNLEKNISILQDMECTASDLFPPGRKRAEIFAHISSYQTPIPLNSRQRCMNCAKSFSQSNVLNVFLNEKFNCRMCGRLVCNECIYPGDYILGDLPSFLSESNNAPKDIPQSTNIKLCIVCQPILVENYGLNNRRTKSSIWGS